MFSTVQLICILLVFTKYNTEYQKLPELARKSYKISCLIHVAITFGWLIMAFTIPLIQESWIAVLVCEILCLVFTIFYSKKLSMQVHAKLQAQLLSDEERRELLGVMGSSTVDSSPKQTMGGAFASMRKMQRVTNDDHAIEVFTRSEIVNGIVNLMDAKKHLSTSDFQSIKAIYQHYNQDNQKVECNRSKYFALCYEILSNFDMVAQVDLFTGDGNNDVVFLKEHEAMKLSYRKKAKLLVESGKLFSNEWNALNADFKELFWNTDDFDIEKDNRSAIDALFEDDDLDIDDNESDEDDSYVDEDDSEEESIFDETEIEDGETDDEEELVEDDLTIDQEEESDDEDEFDDDSYRNPMFGFPMNEAIFKKSQKQSPGFGMVSTESINNVKFLFLNNQGKREVKPNDFIIWWHLRIFGCYGVEQDLDGVEQELNQFFTQLKNDDKDSIKSQGEEMYLQYISFYGSTSITLGTLYAIKHEYVKAIYYYMIGLRTEMVGVMTPYCDFIRYICNKVKKMPAKEAKYNGTGFSADKPCGFVDNGNRKMLVASNAMLIIPELEGKNGEILFAHNSSGGDMYGYLQRLGSTSSESQSDMIDIYETMIIDKNFNLKKIEFYWDGYFSSGMGGKIKIPDGFIIKPNSKLVDDKHNRYIPGYTFV